MTEPNWIQLQRQNAELAQQVAALQAALAKQSGTTQQATANARGAEIAPADTPAWLEDTPLGSTIADSSQLDTSINPPPSLVQRTLLALQRSEARYKTLLRYHPEPIARCLPNGTITAANTAFAHYFGEFDQPVVGDLLFDLIGNDRQLQIQFTEAIAQLERGSKAKPTVQFEHRLVRASSLRWERWIVTGIYAQAGHLLEIQLIGQGISDQRHQAETVTRQPELAEEILQLTESNQQLQQELHRYQQLQGQLERSEARQRSIVSSLHEGVIVTNAIGQIQTGNQSAAQMLGLTVPELLRRSLFEAQWQWVHSNGQPLDLVDHPAQLTLRTGIPCIAMPLGLQRPDQPILWLMVNAQPLFRERQALPDEVVLTLTDITQQKQIERDRQITRQREKAAQAQIAQSQSQIVQVLESVTDCFIACDREWRFSYVNREAARTIGRSGKSLIGQVLWDVFPDFAHSPIAQFLRRGMNAPQSTEVVEYYAPCDRWYSLRLHPSRDQLAIYFRDMTDMFHHVDERNQAAANLQESQERLRQLTENIPHVFWLYDLQEARVLYMSRACEAVLGVIPDRAQQKNWNEWLTRVHPADRAAVRKVSRRPFTGRSGEIIYRFIRPDGSMRWLQGRAFPVRDAQGKVYRIAGIVEDVSDRQQKENWLHLLESVILNANDAVVITEAEPVELPGPHIVFVNDAFSKMMGYSRDEVIGKTPRILQGPKTDLLKLKGVRAALKRWEPVRAELINYRKDGTEVWIELSIFPVTDSCGQYNYWVGIQRDVTQRKQAESDLEKTLLKERELSELKSRFVSTTSHEFRTPLSTILSSVDLLEYYAEQCRTSDTPGESLQRYQEHTRRIQNAALNMNNLLNDILVIEKAEANRWQLAPVDLDLRDFFQRLIEEMRFNDQEQHPIALQIQRSDGVLDQHSPIPLQGDHRLLRQIFTNLLSNALKYSLPSTPIQIQLHCAAQQITITIRDQGIGIPQTDQARLFEPFHRSSNVGTIAGTGLGLAIVKHSVELHQGRIMVQSAVNRGTSIAIVLPRQLQLDQATEQTTAPSLDRNGPPDQT